MRVRHGKPKRDVGVLSRVQAEQYARQQEMVAREMALEKQKQDAFWGNVQGVTNVVNSILR